MLCLLRNSLVVLVIIMKTKSMFCEIKVIKITNKNDLKIFLKLIIIKSFFVFFFFMKMIARTPGGPIKIICIFIALHQKWLIYRCALLKQNIKYTKYVYIYIHTYTFIYLRLIIVNICNTYKSIRQQWVTDYICCS